MSFHSSQEKCFQIEFFPSMDGWSLSSSHCSALSDWRPLTELGEIKFSVQYLGGRDGLRVTVIKCDNLPPEVSHQPINALVKVELQFGGGRAGRGCEVFLLGPCINLQIGVP